ncbi:MAG: hypothetical protein PHH08_02135 [Candidatus ainarchaeum sp.]|nr:hypothetical protein [Candidatus ainarchaeum sp.]
MSRRIVLTERQKRFIKKLGLAPMTPATHIAKHLGLNRAYFDSTLLRAPFNSVAMRFDLVKRFESNPKTRHLLEHPKLWWIYRVKQLASTHSVAEIRKILLQEASEKNSARNKLKELARGKAKAKLASTKYSVPSEAALSKLVSFFGLRSKEDLFKIRSRATRKRKQNDLSEAVRNQLLGKAIVFLNGFRFKDSEGINGDDLVSGITERLMDEVVFFDPRGRTGRYLENSWMRFVRVAMPNFMRDFLRAKGQFSRNGRAKAPNIEEIKAVESRIARAARARPKDSLEAPNMRFAVPLNSQEKRVLGLIQEGFSIKRICVELGLSATRVGQIRISIRSKIVH